MRSTDENVPGIQYNFGIDARRVSATVVIGHIDYNDEEMTEEAFYQTLRTYNSHLSRIDVMTYDQLVSSALSALEMAGASDVGPDANSEAPQPDSQSTVEDPRGSTTTSLSFGENVSSDDPWGSPPAHSFNPGDDPFGPGSSPDDEPPF